MPLVFCYVTQVVGIPQPRCRPRGDDLLFGATRKPTNACTIQLETPTPAPANRIGVARGCVHTVSAVRIRRQNSHSEAMQFTKLFTKLFSSVLFVCVWVPALRVAMTGHEYTVGVSRRPGRGGVRSWGHALPYVLRCGRSRRRLALARCPCCFLNMIDGSTRLMPSSMCAASEKTAAPEISGARGTCSVYCNKKLESKYR